jgi:hypothetical protein
MPETYKVESFTLVVCDATMIYPSRGVADLKNRIIYVQRDINDPNKPRLETLGHEVWHLVDGRWHK